MSNLKVKTEFSKLLKDLNLTIANFCRITKTPYRTVQSWSLGITRTPKIAIILLNIYKFFRPFLLITCKSCGKEFLINKDAKENNLYCPYCSTSDKDKKYNFVYNYDDIILRLIKKTFS